jgi:pimeloyl-ACP methyl ester carboxylesterase
MTSSLTALETWGDPLTWRDLNGRTGIVEGHTCKIIVPRQPKPGLPWVWRTEFFDAFPNADEALVRAGYHLVYLDVQNQFGGPKAVALGNALYNLVTKNFGLHRKVSFIGLSRGGLWAYNWSAANPDKVAALYADNPVCDFKSWPGGFGVGPGSPNAWKLCLEAYGLTEEEAKNYRYNPIDNLAPLAAAGIPILHVVGDADEVVPLADNSDIVKKRYRELGGNYEEIVKPGCKHHPHGLVDPTPIVQFIEKHTKP